MASFLLENIKISLRAIKSQLLRTTLTVFIITIGITSLVGTLTTIDALKASINSNFTRMGANTFTIRNLDIDRHTKTNGKSTKRFKNISYDDAIKFSQLYSFPAKPSVSTAGSRSATVKFESRKSNPNIRVFGGDENYLETTGYELERGRNFSAQDVLHGNPVAILGKEVIEAIFSKQEDPIDKVITIGSSKYKVIGILKSKGNSVEFNGDRAAVLPLNNVRQYFSTPNMTFNINVMCSNPQIMDIAMGEAIGIFRVIRKLNLAEEDNFEVVKSDNLANLLIEEIQTVTMGATIIGFITLIGAAIGLMNIMLVSVSERTREIGIRKAVGATKKIIRGQFLAEALVICQMGGLTGTLFGIIIGNVIAYQFHISFIIPWFWILMSIILCLFVGTLSGIYPAIKASKLDPIDALRFE